MLVFEFYNVVVIMAGRSAAAPNTYMELPTPIADELDLLRQHLLSSALTGIRTTCNGRFQPRFF